MKDKEFIQSILDKIGEFGNGELEFETRDIERLCNIALKAVKNNEDVIQWVAITTPPTVDCFYLVYDKTYGMISKALYDNEFHLVEDMPDIEITHWAHLPKPPCLYR